MFCTGTRDSIVSVAGDESTLKRQKTIAKISKQSGTKKTALASNLDDAFEKRFQKLSDELDKEKSAEDIGENIIGRRKTRNQWKSVRAIAHMQTANKRGKICHCIKLRHIWFLIFFSIFE